MRYDIGMEMEDELIKCYAYNNNSNTSQLKTKQDKTRQDIARWNIHRSVAYNHNDIDDDNHYSMNSDSIKIIS